MDPEMITSLGKIGGALAVTFAAIGSSLGTGAAGMAAIGAWKKCYAQNKMAPFMLVVFIGAPLSQTVYGFLLQGFIGAAAAKAAEAGVAAYPALIAAGLGGLAMGASAWMQGKAGAGASDALAETGKGFGNYLMALGVIVSVAILVVIFIGMTI